MCDRCENPGAAAGLFARAEVAPAPAPLREALPPTPPTVSKVQRRPRLWELEEKHHCPVIGTCLNLDDLLRVARKSGFTGTPGDPYRLHVEAVSLSCTRNAAAEAMEKMLEKKYAVAVTRFQRVKSDAEVRALWREALESGEVAGAMWATLTHKAVSRETRNQVYGDVHMLSHQIGAGQAADLRRLEALQRNHAALQSEHAALKAGAAEKAVALTALGQQLEQAREIARDQAAQLESLARRVQELESGQAMVALGRRLLIAEAQAARATELELRGKSLAQRVGMLRADKVRLNRELDEVRDERDGLERLWTDAAPGAVASCSGSCEACDSRLQGQCVLCVGGRTPLLPQYRLLAERLGVRLIHHDGGKEEALARLPDLLNASDAVICPTDCVGHLAYYQLKKHCKQSGKPCVLAKSSGVAGFAAALNRLVTGDADINTQT
jgi:hypothetical protein